MRLLLLATFLLAASFLAIGVAVLPATSMSALQDRPPPPAETKTALLAASCTGCHVRVPTKDGFPSIYGRPAAEIRDLLRSFRSGEREGTVMNRLATGYTDAEIDLLADFFAMQGTAQ